LVLRQSSLDTHGYRIQHSSTVEFGDQIQATCVYNSLYRDTNTPFGLSTYEEMCIIDLQLTFATPPINDVSGIGMIADLNLRSFSCDVMADDDDDTDDEETTDNTEEDMDTNEASSSPVVTKQSIHVSDVWQGVLDVDEDPRNIWRDHPITSTEMCTFPVGDFVVLDSFITSKARNCPVSMSSTTPSEFDSSSICYGYETTTATDEGGASIEFLTATIAGYTCRGGTYDEKDSNEPPLFVGKEACLAGVEGNGGTSYDAYTCEGIQYWLRHEATTLWGLTDEVKEFIRTDWYQPKCCRVVRSDSTSVELEEGEGDSDSDSETSADTTTTLSTAAAAEESSSSSSSVANVAASSVVIIIMTTTMMVL